MIDIIKDNLPLCVTVVGVALMSVIEVSKIKINPWTFLFNAIGKAINKELETELKALKEEVTELKKDNEQEKRERAQDACFSYRNTIINDANRLRKGEQFTRSKYNTLIEMHSRYNALVDKNKLPNDVLEFDYEYIMERMRQADENGELM